MARTHRIGPETTNIQTLIHSRDLTARLAERRLGGMVLVDYLFDLFASSPLEVFSRLSVLSLLDQVKRDKMLFPDGVQTVCAGDRRECFAPNLHRVGKLGTQRWRLGDDKSR